MGVTVREKIEGSGVWWIFLKHQGKRKSKKIGDKKVARQVAEKIKAQLVLGDFQIEDDSATAPEAPLFRDYSSLWLEGYIKPLRRASTYERYRDILRLYINPAIGGKPIDQVKRSDIRDLLLKTFNDGFSKSTVNIIRDAISGVLGYAVDEELIPTNPVRGVTKKLGLEREKRAPAESMTPEEVRLFLDTCADHFPDHYPFFLTAFRTGMRLGELLGLRWGDVDWNSKFIQVSRSYKNQRISPTKTGRVRRVDMSDQLIETLRGLYTQRKREALKAGRGEVEEAIFIRKGEPMAQNSIRNIFKRILRKAGLREFRIHDVRHCFASLLLSMGQSPAYVKEQMGHSSIQITVDIYGHLIPSSNREAVNQLDSLGTFGHPIGTLQKS